MAKTYCVMDFHHLTPHQLFLAYWETQAVYRILNAPQLATGKGILAPSVLAGLLDQKRYPRATWPFIVDLMSKFELCYELEKNQRILIPDLLPAEEPDLPHLTNPALIRFRYHFLPRTLMPRFIVRHHASIEQNLCCRSGVVLHHPQYHSKEVVRVDYEERQILIQTGGGLNQHFLTELRGAVNALNQGFQNNLILEELACTCPTCRDSTQPEYRSYELLVQCFLQKVLYQPCTTGGDLVLVSELLGEQAAPLEELVTRINTLMKETEGSSPKGEKPDAAYILARLGDLNNISTLVSSIPTVVNMLMKIF